jgi:alcohol dehydrogenase
VEAVGRDVWHLKKGQRVIVSSLVRAGENVVEPAQFLFGVTAMGATARAMQEDWRDGMLAEYALVPKALVTPADKLAELDAVKLSTLMRFVVPYGGLVRGRLTAGETLIVVGATGAYASAAVLLALAMGAARVVAAGRSAEALEDVARAGGKRVVPVVLRGDLETDMRALREASGGGAQVVFDMVGGAKDPTSTLAALKSLRREGRLILMGSMSAPLPVPYMEMMANSWQIIGNFMHPDDAYLRLFDLVRAGLLNVDAIRTRVFGMTALREAMEAAAHAKGLECVVVEPQRPDVR